jgi:hypothetical protein
VSDLFLFLPAVIIGSILVWTAVETFRDISRFQHEINRLIGGPQEDRDRVLAEKAAWEEIWGIEEAYGLPVQREPMPTRPNPTMDSGPRMTDNPGPRMAPPIPLRNIHKYGTASGGPG